MNGAEVLISNAVKRGIEICFANPGTTELPLVLAMDTVPGMRGVLCLHENVATGAADGYARMAGKPAMCLLHLGPGFANGLTNLHNARRAGTPIVVVIGEHASWHRAADPLLHSDIEALAGTVSAFVRRCRGAETIAADVNAAIDAALGNGIATVIVPHDAQIGEVVAAGQPAGALQARKSYSAARVDPCAKALKAGRCALLLGGDALSEAGQMLAGRIAAATGADLIAETFFARMERGAGLPHIKKLAYFPDLAIALTRRYEKIVLAGTRRPVAFFGYPGVPSHLTSEQQTVMLAAPHEDVIGAFRALVGELNAPASFEPQRGSRPDMPRGDLNALSVSAVIARLQPEHAIVMDEALTVGTPYFELSMGAPRFTQLELTGGAIGQGPSAAAGAALGAPNRKIINFQSDGCGAYSVQAFWSEARENLDVVTIIGSNRSYNILNVELQRAGVATPGANARALASLDQPHLDWVKIGEGFGVPSIAVDTVEGLARALDHALSQNGPRLIEAVMG